MGILGAMEVIESGERAMLVALVSAGHGEAYEACRDALTSGDPFQLWTSGEPVDASSLARIYARRQRLCERKGIGTLGHAESVQRLRALEGDAVHLAQVTSSAPPYRWAFILFLSRDLSRVHACTAVERRSRQREPHPG
ncbi:hypothetical protein GCM10029964_121590 [Kibdelosporangium lantanae]